jgi:hypothetical protein
MQLCKLDMKRLSVPKNNEYPLKFHQDIFMISIENLAEIKNAYRDVLRLKYIDHLSVNIVSPENEIVFLSATPATGINVCASGLIKYDSSINPLVFKTKDFYFWDDCYEESHHDVLKFFKEKSNGLTLGFICSKQVNDYSLLYSFATSGDPDLMRRDIADFKDTFFQMGDECYNRVRELYISVTKNCDAPKL